MYLQKALFSKTHGFLLHILKLPKCLSPTSHFHFSNKTLISDAKLGFVLKEVEELQSLKPHESKERGGGGEIQNQSGLGELLQVEPKVQISHQWPEWIDLMEHLLKKGYIGGGDGQPLNRIEIGMKDSNRIRTACLNFARDRFDLIRYLSRKDIKVVVGSGCPSIDRKVVNSAKRLRAHVGVEEGNVCSSCNLRGSCERAYVKARDDEDGRTVDVMRILLTYGLDSITGSVENMLCLNKRVKESVRLLLTKMVEFSNSKLDPDHPNAIRSKRKLSMLEHSSRQHKGEIDVPTKQGDWLCPKCNFLNFAKNIKCLRCDGLFRERLRKLGEDQDHLPMKKGDWLCDKCNFLNFAKNTRCLQCKEKPPKRQLHGGEWECESCNYINFKRNMVCLKCNWKRPKASNYSSAVAEHEDGSFHQPYGMKFVRDDDEVNSQPSFKQERQGQKEGAHFWGFVEDEDEDDGLSPQNKFSKFKDFPIVGGKSALSQNSQVRERWKVEMSKRSQSVSREQENYDDSDSWFALAKKIEYLESDDDEEMVGWFGSRSKFETENGKTVPESCRE